MEVGIPCIHYGQIYTKYNLFTDEVISYISEKIGKFEVSELLYQDKVHAFLLFMADCVIDLIDLKYLKAAVSYHKETRVETYPFARDAVRKAVYNMLIRCNWADNNPIQIRIEDDAMYISNSSLLPFGWSAQSLLEAHSSKSFNPEFSKFKKIQKSHRITA